MPTKSDNIALIGPYGTICGCAEYQRFFAEALQRAKKNITFLANRCSSAYPSCSLYDDTPNVTRVFGTGHAPKPDQGFDVKLCVDTIIKSKCTIAYLNYQDYLYPDKPGLYQALTRLAAARVSLFLILHDTCLPDMPFSLFRAILVPSQQCKSARFPTASKVFVVPQGVPVFKKIDRKKFREDFAIGHEDDIILTTFGLGRSNNAEVIQAARKATQVLGRDPDKNPIITQMIFSKMDDYNQAVEQWGNDDDTLLQGGYQEDFKLSAYLQAGNAVVLNYAPLKGQYATSSALRFAIGSGCLVLAQESNWFADVKDQGLYLPYTGVHGLVTQLATIFASKNAQEAAEAKVARNGGAYVKKFNWDEIVKMHFKIWRQAL